MRLKSGNSGGLEFIENSAIVRTGALRHVRNDTWSALMMPGFHFLHNRHDVGRCQNVGCGATLQTSSSGVTRCPECKKRPHAKTIANTQLELKRAGGDPDNVPEFIAIHSNAVRLSRYGT